MTPNIINSKANKAENSKDKKHAQIRKKIKAYQKFIKKHFHYVGDKFAYEARSIHYNNKKNDPTKHS